MKTSNKLLLAGFFAVVLLITAIHVSLYAKYKNGDYTLYHPEDEFASQAMQSFPNILFVSVHNLHNATVQFSDLAAVSKVEDNEIEYIQKGDSLVITGPGTGDGDFVNTVALQLPSKAKLSLVNSSVYFQPSRKVSGTDHEIYLKKSTAIFSSAGYPLKLGKLKMVATDSSAALFQGNTTINQLDVQLSKSAIDYGEGSFGQMSIVTDSLSRISLQSKHLLKAIIKTIPSQ